METASTSTAPPEVRTPHEPVGAPRKKGMKWIPLAIIGALLLGGLYLRNRSTGGPPPNAAAARGPQLPVVKVVPVSTGDIIQTLEVTGALKSNQSIDLGSKISGRVAQVYVNEGDRVRRGQLLIALDDEDLRAQVRRRRRL
jgi:multidrug efflux pump subunit AcrA (membrane-fusion protein)